MTGTFETKFFGAINFYVYTCNKNGELEMETTAAGVVQKPILKNSIVLLAHKVSSLSENGINALWRSPIVPSSKPLPLLPNDSVQKYLDSDYYLTIYLATQDFNIKNL